MKIFSYLILSTVFASSLGMADEISNVPEFMQSFVIDPSKTDSKDKIAFNNMITLNDNMFTIYDRSIGIYRNDFLSHHHLIMGLFSGKGGRFILYRPGQPPLEAESVPSVYQAAKSIGHCAMATFVLLSPYTSDPSANLAWLGSLKAYRTNVQTAIDSLGTLDVKPEVRDLFRAVLNQIAAFMDNSIKNRTYTYDELESFARNIKPDLAKLIDVGTNAQVKHWWGVLEQWKKMIGKDWNSTYGLSNSIYVARQNNILFSILVQFFGQEAINDRLILLETTDFTTTPELMMDAFMRIVSDRLIGEVFFKNPRLMDFELLGGSARKVIEREATDHGFKAILPPQVPFNSTAWPWKMDPSTGTGPSNMDQIH
jgi:hypothetical protein